MAVEIIIAIVKCKNDTALRQTASGKTSHRLIQADDCITVLPNRSQTGVKKFRADEKVWIPFVLVAQRYAMPRENQGSIASPGDRPRRRKYPEALAARKTACLAARFICIAARKPFSSISRISQAAFSLSP